MSAPMKRLLILVLVLLSLDALGQVKRSGRRWIGRGGVARVASSDTTLAPVVTTVAASSITTTGATLKSTVSWKGLSTTARMVYGLVSGTYTDSANCALTPVTGTSVADSLVVTGLTQGTTYYFRAVGSNTKGYTRGSELSFTTTPTYALQDEFSVDTAAGKVNSSHATDGSLRTATDTGNRMSIASGGLVSNGGSGSFGDPGLWYPSVSRQAGKMLITSFSGSAFTGIGYVGFDANNAGQTTGPNFCWVNTSTIGPYYDGVTAGAWTMTAGTGTGYLMNVLQRTSGAFWMVKGGTFTNWTLVDYGTVTAAATLYPNFEATAGTYGIDFVHIPVTRWLPTPIASDGFASSFGTTDGKGTQEGVADSTGKGGSGITWISQTGTQRVTSAKALAATTVNGMSIATVPCPNQETIVQAQFTRGVGTGRTGLVVRFADTSNFVSVVCDSLSGKIITKKRVLGVFSTVDSTTFTYSAGKELRVVCHGSTFDISYNNTAIKSGVSIPEAILGSSVGLYFSNTVDQLDNFVAFARGSGANEYAYLDRFGSLPAVAGPDTSKTQIPAIGHSMIYAGFIETALTDSLGSNYATINKGVNGNTVAQMSARLQTDVIDVVSGMPHTPYLIVLGGIVEIGWDTSAATVKANLQSIYTAAHNAGIKVIAVTSPPFKGYSAWNSSRQAVLDDVNSWIMSGATNVDYRIDAYTAVEDGGNPDQMLSTYDSGDHLHPSVAGYRIIGASIYHGVTWTH